MNALRLGTLSGLLCLCGTAFADEYTVQPLDEGPPAEVAADVAPLLQATGLRVANDKGRALCDLWLCAEWAVEEEFEPSSTVLYPFAPGELLGVLRFPRKTEDFRGQQLSRGVYTLRYAQQPVDGNHVGTSDTRDFLLLLPAADDADGAVRSYEELVELSKQASGTTHPAMLCLLSAPPADAELPAMHHLTQREFWALRLAGAAPGGDAVPVQLVLVGQAAE